MTVQKLASKNGFTLIEVLALVLLLSILSVVSILMVSDTLDEQHFNTTIKQMNEIREAIVGKWEPQSFGTGDGLGMSLNANWAPQWANVVGLWHLDESAGTTGVATVKDSSGQANHGDTVGAPVFNILSKVRTGLTTSSGNYFTVPHATSLDLTANITLSAWIKTTDAAAYDFFISKDANSGFQGYDLLTNNGYARADFNAVGPTTIVNLTGTTLVNDGVWHLITATYDGSTGKLYVDGALQKSVAYAGGVVSNSNSLKIGAAYSGVRPYVGTIDEVAIWNSALTAGEISNIYLRQNKGYRPLHRTTFGFAGDIGAIPIAGQGLAALWTNPGLPAWAIAATTRIGMGWNGPYLSNGFLGTDYTKDGWGTAYVYSPAASPPTLISLGADKTPGGTGLNADITVQIPAMLTSATVRGVIWNNGNPWAGTAQAELNAPDGTGVLTQTLVNLVPANNGAFTFSGVPLGTRSVTIYEPSKAGVVTTAGPYLFPVDRNNTAVTIQATGL